MILLVEDTESVLCIVHHRNDSAPLPEWREARKAKRMISGRSRQTDLVTARTEILTAMITESTVIWDVIPCSLVHHYIFWGHSVSIYRLGEASSLKKEAAGSFGVVIMIDQLRSVSSQRAVLVMSLSVRVLGSHAVCDGWYTSCGEFLSDST